ncbi:MAG: glycosyltransferase, partial [Lachnospiraceae bacterium]|nr:glycosyltransferase [Lachnospiraceae bacterium]
MQILYLISAAIGILFLVCYAYQLAYIPAVWIGRRNARKSAETVKNTGEAAAGGAAGGRQALPVRVRDVAALICARNEETVIRDLIRSLKAQTYPRAHLKIFVMADNCTDRTADMARAAGALVYERQNTEQVGKGWALQALLGHIREDFP